MNIEKISFVSGNNEAVFSAYEPLAESERAAISDILCQYSCDDPEITLAFCVSFGTVIVRMFDGSDYSFFFPHKISDQADIAEAVQSVVRYAVLEQISPVIESVPAESVGVFFCLGYRHVTVDADSPDAETYRVTLQNECDLIAEYPSFSDGDITLSQLEESDVTDYARLLRDSENNKYWGYDYTEDYPNCEDRFFLTLAEREFDCGSALSFAIRVNGAFIGEALIASFDYKGGADLAIRILPEYQNKGYAKRVLSILFDISARIGLVTLYARVYRENAPSLALFGRKANEEREENGISVFTYDLFA